MVQYRSVDTTLAALADPTRRAIIERLGQGPASITELAEPFSMSLTGMRKHVLVLEAARLVETTKVGRIRHCRLEPRRLKDLQDWIQLYRRMVEQRIDRFGDLIDRTQGDSR